MRTIKIFDTTLRDGEQSPGASMNIDEKLTVARQLTKLRVDVIEAGYPIASPGDFEAVKRVAEEIDGPIICALARAKNEDIDRAGDALKSAERKRIHTFIATSDLHLQFKLRMSREDVLAAAIAAVKRARMYSDDVEFSAEDATRSDIDYLCRVIEAAIDAGARTVNIPDTVGYVMPPEYGEIISSVLNRVPNIDKAVISVHCHNDLGLAVSNSLVAVLNGAGQVECTINGIGERAGNASLEEIVMAMKTRQRYFETDTNILTEEIYKTSRLVARFTWDIQRNKAIVGANAFAHEAGIHQDGFLKEKSTYEIMRPESIGIPSSKLVLGKHSGRHAFRERLKKQGYDLSEEELNKAFERFKHLSDQKKEIFDEDLEAIVAEEIYRIPEVYSLIELNVISGTTQKPVATLKLKVGDDIIEKTDNGDGPVDAAYRTIAEITGTKSSLLSYIVKGITGGTEAMGEVTVTLEEDGRTVRGSGADTDIIVASAKAYINALNKIAYLKRNR